MTNRLDDAGVVAFLMRHLRREKSGGFTWRPNIAVLAPAIGAVVDEVPLSMNTLPTLAIYGGQSNYVDASDLDQFNRRACSFSPMKSRARAWLHASHPEEFFEEVADFLGA